MTPYLFQKGVSFMEQKQLKIDSIKSRSYDFRVAHLYGIVASSLLNNIAYFSDYHNGEEYWHNQSEIAWILGCSEYQIRNAKNKLEEAGIIQARQSYKPNSNVKTTYWKICENAGAIIDEQWEQFLLSVNEKTKSSEPKKTKSSEPLETASSETLETSSSLYKSNNINLINKSNNKNNFNSINTIKRAKSSKNTCITEKNLNSQNSEISQSSIKPKKTSKQNETLNIETNSQTEENLNSIKPKELNSKKHREPNEWGGYGKPEIDHLFYEWEKSVKTPLTGTKQLNRNTAQRLLKKYSEDDLIGAIKIVALTKQTDDRYIPVINSLMDLENKFGSLVHWYQKNKQAYEEQQRIKQATEGDTLSEEDLLAYMEMMKDE
jgi:hypothetical protein|nr:MAG TPA: helix-turn-helix domain protein [Caudoviricetes sp.]